VDLYPHLQNLTDMKPVVVNPSIQAQGITTLNGIAAALNGRRAPTPRGGGKWEATQVRRLLNRLRHPPE
jgi:hypothetical protein